MTIRFIVPGNIGHRSGGNLYNARLVEHLEALGARTEVVMLDGGWPPGRPEDRESSPGSCVERDWRLSTG